MLKVQKDLTRIENAEFQRERLLAMTEETNKQLISESYKFILWSILAILVVLALIKLKEMFGQDDDDGDGDGDGANSGGFLAKILAFFGIGKIDTSDISDKTGDVKAGLAQAGEQIMEASNNLSTSITEGADNIVSSVSETANGAIDSAKGFVDKVSETATDAVNTIGDTVNGTSAPKVGGRSNFSRSKRK
jgi:hypothetical protein